MPTELSTRENVVAWVDREFPRFTPDQRAALVDDLFMKRLPIFSHRSPDDACLRDCLAGWLDRECIVIAPENDSASS